MNTPKTTGSSDDDDGVKADRARPGRNDPCPCGSGKKYKKCCWDEDRQNAPDRVAPGWAQEDLPLPDAENDLAAPDQWPAPQGPRLNRDQYEKRISRFQRALDSKDFNDDGAMELLADMHREFVQHGESARYADLVAELRDRAPQAYEETSPYFLNHQISDALAAADIERTRVLAMEMAVEGQEDADVFFRALHELCLHGQLSILLEMMPIAWEWIAADEGDLMGYAVDEFRELANSLEIASWADQHPDGTNTEALAERLKLYGEVVWQKVLESANILSGRARLEWSLADFMDMGKRRRKRQREDRGEDPGAEEANADQDQAAAQVKISEGWDRRKSGVNLFLLTLDFMCYARAEEAFPYPTLILACDNMREYLFDRQDGRHDQQWNGFGRSARHRRPHEACNFLVPDEPTMDHWGGELLSFPFPQPSRAAAMLLVLPAWLRFLVARGLATEAEAAAALASLRPLAQTASRVLADNEVPSNILADLRRRWDEPAGTTIP